MRSVAITELDILARRRCHHWIARRFGHWNWGSVTGLSKPLRAAQSLKPPALPGDTYMAAIDLLDRAVLRLTLAPFQHHSLVGQEHGRTIPLADLRANSCSSDQSRRDCTTASPAVRFDQQPQRLFGTAHRLKAAVGSGEQKRAFDLAENSRRGSGSLLSVDAETYQCLLDLALPTRKSLARRLADGLRVGGNLERGGRERAAFAEVRRFEVRRHAAREIDHEGLG